MNHKLCIPFCNKVLHLLFSAILFVVLTVSMAPAQRVHAEGITTTSDLVVNLVSIPKHAKACQTFEVTFTVTNLGPDSVSHLTVGVGITDQFDPVGALSAPDSLAAGATITVTAVIKVTAFVPGESRNGRVSVGAGSDPFPDSSIDPNPENNNVERTVKLISNRVMSCP